MSTHMFTDMSTYMSDAFMSDRPIAKQIRCRHFVEEFLEVVIRRSTSEIEEDAEDNCGDRKTSVTDC